MKLMGRCVTLSLIAAFVVCGYPCAVHAERIETVLSDGSLKLQTGEAVYLAGLETANESFTMLNMLVKDKDADIQYEDSLPSKANGSRAAYVFVPVHEIRFPFRGVPKPEENKILINEFLLLLGAARVDLNRNFRRFHEFQKAEDDAKLRGEGVWSYDESFKERKVG